VPQPTVPPHTVYLILFKYACCEACSHLGLLLKIWCVCSSLWRTNNMSSFTITSSLCVFWPRCLF